MVTPLEETIKGQKSLFPYPKISSSHSAYAPVQLVAIVDLLLVRLVV